jgi:hypothetical protein
MKHIAPQFDLPGTEDAFNLAVQCAPAVAHIQPVRSDLSDFDRAHPSTDHCDLFTAELYREQGGQS